METETREAGGITWEGEEQESPVSSRNPFVVVKVTYILVHVHYGITLLTRHTVRVWSAMDVTLYAILRGLRRMSDKVSTSVKTVAMESMRL